MTLLSYCSWCCVRDGQFFTFAQNMMPLIRSACVEMFFFFFLFLHGSAALDDLTVSPVELNLNGWSCLANLKGQFMN